MKLYRTTAGAFVEVNSKFYFVDSVNWDELICDRQLISRLTSAASNKPAEGFDISSAIAPIVSQEVWAAGVTYFRSRDARIEESKDAGGGDFYDRVYSAVRPEIFFKATGRRVVGPGAAVRIRSDSSWSVPEPELTVAVNPEGSIIGYTIGNDMSSRDIEGENPLYLPQAKIYDGSCALGPCILISSDPLATTTEIKMEISRKGETVLRERTILAELRRKPEELIEFLYRDNTFPDGAFLMTGTGIVPGYDFTLSHGDIIRITIDAIGTLENYVG